MASFPGFVGPAYRSQSKIASDDALVNWYAERIESPSAKAEWALYPTPGYSELLEVGDGPIRALYQNNGRTFVVSGAKLYEVLNDWTSIERGSGLNDLDGSPAQIWSNGDGGLELFITSGSKGYVYDLTANTLTFVIDAADQCGFIDGFFLALDAGTSTLKISDLEDGATWDPLQVAQRNAGADRWGGMICSHKEIWLFGAQTSEVWYNAGATPFPFAPNPSVFLNIGILAPSSAVILDNAPAWLGQSADGNAIVYRAEGYSPRRISTHALEYELSTYETLTDAQGWTYQEQGHNFYVLTFPTAGRTWVFDASTGQWHQRGVWNGLDYGAVAVYGHCMAFGYHLTGSTTDGTIYRQAVSITTEAGGGNVRRMRRAPHLSKENVRIGFDRMQLDLEVGLGLTEGDEADPAVVGSDPRVMLRWSNDGGQTWSNQVTASAGKLGEYSTRTVWRRLGSGRDRVFEVSVSDPIPWRVMGAWIDTRTGTS